MVRLKLSDPPQAKPLPTQEQSAERPRNPTGVYAGKRFHCMCSCSNAARLVVRIPTADTCSVYRPGPDPSATVCGLARAGVGHALHCGIDRLGGFRKRTMPVGTARRRRHGRGSAVIRWKCPDGRCHSASGSPPKQEAPSSQKNLTTMMLPATLIRCS
jgi:hypothetical protein